MAVSFFEDNAAVMWITVIAFIVAFVLAMGLGANDVANSFGTSVGAKVLTLYQACIVAAIFETLGAIFLGYRVSDTIRKGLFDPMLYNEREELLMLGNLCALCGSCIWLFTATFFSVPVSATHSIVGASLGFHIVVFGNVGIDWSVVIIIVISWFISPLFSGLISSIIYGILNLTILKPEDPMKTGLYTTPLWYFLIIFVNFFSIFYGSSIIFGFDEIWIVCTIATGGGLLAAAFGYFFVVPYTQKRVTKLRKAAAAEAAEEGHSEKKEEQETDFNQISTQFPEKTDGAANGGSDDFSKTNGFAKTNPDDPDAILCPDPETQSNGTPPPSYMAIEVVEDSKSEAGDELLDDEDESKWMVSKESKLWQSVKDSIEVRAICSPLQVMSASFAAFSHGGNDVSNAIGPLISIWIIFTTGEVSQEAMTPIWILLYGGLGISCGLFLLGRRVIKTIGEDLTPMTPSNGFCIELGSATTVLIASNLGIPVSTTHCQVGSVCGIGWLRTRKAVDWPLFSGIFFAWVVTVPATIMLSAALMGLFQHTVPGVCVLEPIPYNTTNATTMIATTLGM